MPTKKQISDAKNKIVAMYAERPIEMMIATGALLTGVAKVVHSINESQNAVSWRREVNRRNRNSMR
jgi:hypothetical protein